MNFDLDRIAKLAGIESDKTALNEAGNRSYHEDPSLASEAEVQWSGQLNETEENVDEAVEENVDEAVEENVDEAVEENVDEAVEEGAEEDEVVLEIDEDMLREEILKMKQEREQKLNESHARKVIRSELEKIFEELGVGDAGWIYGDNKPKNSKEGSVNVAFTGPGFKK